MAIKLNKKCVVILGLLLITTHIIAAPIRDYYAEPGINPFQETINQNFSEHIDPFGGTLQLSYTDLVVPGNGGMDIRVNRSYTSLQYPPLPERGVNGLGWTMHFGRILFNATDEQGVCQRLIDNTSNNPSLELPDGSREILVVDDDPSLPKFYVTKRRWRADCNLPAGGLTVTSPEGIQYEMDVKSTVGLTTSFYTSQITDLNGNVINIAYGTQGFTNKYITSVSSLDGRSVQFNYLDVTNTNIRLDNIQSNGQIWRYSYIQIPSSTIPGTHYQLSQVTRPDTRRWQYAYHGLVSPQPGSFSLNRITYPYGGIINYSYQSVSFDAISGIATTAIRTKTTSDSGARNC